MRAQSTVHLSAVAGGFAQPNVFRLEGRARSPEGSRHLVIERCKPASRAQNVSVRRRIRVCGRAAEESRWCPTARAAQCAGSGRSPNISAAGIRSMMPLGIFLRSTYHPHGEQLCCHCKLDTLPNGKKSCGHLFHLNSMNHPEIAGWLSAVRFATWRIHRRETGKTHPPTQLKHTTTGGQALLQRIV